MKLILISLVLLFSISACKDKEKDEEITPVEKGLFSESMSIDGLSREYLLYIPEGYDGANPVPLVFSFHGWNETMTIQYNRSKFNELADKEEFIIVTPQALENKDGNIIWNVRHVPLNVGSPDDVKYISALIDEMSARYNINLDRVYCCGFSNGGYFSFELACQLSDRIAALGSVGGAMNPFQYENCNKTRPMPVVQFHGTIDQLIEYSEAEKVLDHYISFNQTSMAPFITELPDKDPDDGSVVQHYLYTNGTNESEIEHFKVIGGDHDWFGYSGNMDIDASGEIWKFLSQFDIHGKIK